MTAVIMWKHFKDKTLDSGEEAGELVMMKIHHLMVTLVKLDPLEAPKITPLIQVNKVVNA